MKRLTAVLALLTLGALLTGCAGEDSTGLPRPGTVRPHYVDLPDGRTVLCVYENTDHTGGLSCDWATATSPKGATAA